MNEYISISFSEKLIDIEAYFKSFDKSHYDGKLNKGIESGKLIWLEKERILIGKKRLETYENWLKNFEELINLYGFQNNDETEQLKQFIESRKVLDVFKGLNKNDFFNNLGLGIIFSLFNKILDQPFYYTETLMKYDLDLTENQKIWHRYRFLQNKISFAKYKFKEMYFAIRAEILRSIQSEPDKMVELFKELILVSERLQMTILYFDDRYSFKFSKSPLFNVYMDFVKDVQYYLNYLDKGGKLPLINRHLDKMDEYKKPFEIIMLPAPENAEIKILSLSEMFTIPEKLEKICNTLEENGFIIKTPEKKYLWKGNPLNRRAKKMQLVALNLCCSRLYKDSYKDNEIHKAFNSYFNIKTSDTIFKDCESGNAIKFKALFHFINSI